MSWMPPGRLNSSVWHTAIALRLTAPRASGLQRPHLNHQRPFRALDRCRDWCAAVEKLCWLRKFGPGIMTTFQIGKRSPVSNERPHARVNELRKKWNQTGFVQGGSNVLVQRGFDVSVARPCRVGEVRHTCHVVRRNRCRCSNSTGGGEG